MKEGARVYFGTIKTGVGRSEFLRECINEQKNK